MLIFSIKSMSYPFISAIVLMLRFAILLAEIALPPLLLLRLRLLPPLLRLGGRARVVVLLLSVYRGFGLMARIFAIRYQCLHESDARQ